MHHPLFKKPALEYVQPCILIAFNACIDFERGSQHTDNIWTTYIQYFGDNVISSDQFLVYFLTYYNAMDTSN